LDVVDDFIESTASQLSLTTDFAVAGTAAIFFVWLRVFGAIESKDFRNFRRPTLLVFPLIFLFISIAFNYFVRMEASGYRYEMAISNARMAVPTVGEGSLGLSICDKNMYEKADEDKSIKIVLHTDPVRYFGDCYIEKITWKAYFNLISVAVGVLLLFGWMLVNVISLQRSSNNE